MNFSVSAILWNIQIHNLKNSEFNHLHELPDQGMTFDSEQASSFRPAEGVVLTFV